MHLRIWPQGLIGRVILVLMCAVLVEFAGSSFVYEFVELRAARIEQAQAVAEQLVVAERSLSATSKTKRALAARSLTTGNVIVAWRASSISPLPEAPDDIALEKVHSEMLAWEPSLAGRDLRVDLHGGRHLGEPIRLLGSVRLSDGSTVVVSSLSEASSMTLLLTALSSAAVLAFGVLIAAGVLLRSLGMPLRALAGAADSVGRGDPVHVREEGAGDLRRVARAFNAMQTRIADLIAGRTRALAAVSHDLRTPLSRLRLRAGLVEDASTRAALEQDVDEMAAMLDSLLAYLSGNSEGEAIRRVDLAAVCMTLVDAATDAGREASYAGPDHLSAQLRISAVRRAIDNLIQNALIYGGRADVTLEASAGYLTVRVEDEGPGIAEADMERVRMPFERLDHSRARNTKGLGLGLSVVDQVARQEGGQFLLSNRPQGGLRAELRLPLER